MNWESLIQVKDGVSYLYGVPLWNSATWEVITLPLWAAIGLFLAGMNQFIVYDLFGGGVKIRKLPVRFIASLFTLSLATTAIFVIPRDPGLDSLGLAISIICGANCIIHLLCAASNSFDESKTETESSKSGNEGVAMLYVILCLAVTAGHVFWPTLLGSHLEERYVLTHTEKPIELADGGYQMAILPTMVGRPRPDKGWLISTKGMEFDVPRGIEHDEFLGRMEGNKIPPTRESVLTVRWHGSKDSSGPITVDKVEKGFVQ